MNKSIMRRAFSGIAPLAFYVALSCLGCGGANENERENARTAAPGIPSENPNESFAERRARTRVPSKQEKKIEQRNAAAEKKAAGASR